MKRIYILGTMGSGKTTLAKEISKKLKIKACDLDDVFWKRKFDLKRDEKERSQRVKKIIQKKEWIIEGVYSSWGVEDILTRATHVIMLDFPVYVLWYRVMKRYLARSGLHKEKIFEVMMLLKYIWLYKRRGPYGGYYEHIKQIKKSKGKYICITSQKQKKIFLDTLNSSKEF